MSESFPEVYLARHGETAWSLSGQHTGRTDIPLTERGERNAADLAGRLAGIAFTHIYTSPMRRARRTCELAGFGDRVEVMPGLGEWDYGGYEGLLGEQIRARSPGWAVFRDGCPGGESPAQIGTRADGVVATLRREGGRILLFAHAHIFRVLTARWLGLPVGDGAKWMLSTASVSMLGYEHGLDEPAIRLWNDTRHVRP